MTSKPTRGPTRSSSISCCRWRDWTSPTVVRSRSILFPTPHLQEVPLIDEDEEALALLRRLKERGYNTDDVAQAMDRLDAIPVTKVRQRQADRAALDMRIRTEVGRILGERGINHQGHDLDKQRLNRTNFVVVKAAIDKQANAIAGLGPKERSEFTQAQFDAISADFEGVVARAVKEVLDA